MSAGAADFDPDVAAQLEAWSAPGGVLDARGPNATSTLFKRDPRRRRLLASVRDEYLDQQYDVGHDGSVALLAAGPPAAGKSSAMARLDAGYRHIDPDRIKDLLIRAAMSDGLYDPLLELILPDGRRVRPRELSGLVHEESTQIANDVMHVATTRRENLLIEGTLGWWAHAEYLLHHLESTGYARLEILSFDVPEAIAASRSLARWWAGRVSNADGLGGRYVPRSVITNLYSKTVDKSDCAYNARELFERAKGTIDEVHLREEDLTEVNEYRHSS